MNSSLTTLTALILVFALVLSSAAQTAAFERPPDSRTRQEGVTDRGGASGRISQSPRPSEPSRTATSSTPVLDNRPRTHYSTSTYVSSITADTQTPRQSATPSQAPSTGQSGSLVVTSIPLITFDTTIPLTTQQPTPNTAEPTVSPPTTTATRSTPPAPTLVTRIRTYFNLPVTVCLASSAISLVFEQGPDPVLTPQYLDVLRELGVQATFFVLGQRVTPATIPIIQRAEAEGHLIGFTGWSVQAFPTLTMEQVNHEVSATARIVSNARKGLRPLYFRFPNGEFTPSQLAWVTSQGYLTVGSSLDVDDVSGLEPRQLFVRWQQRLSPLATSNRYIAVAHDAENSTLPVLRNIVALARSRGYSFLRLDDCLERDENTLKQIRRHEGLGNGMLIPRVQGNGTGRGSAGDRSSHSVAGAVDGLSLFLPLVAMLAALCL